MRVRAASICIKIRWYYWFLSYCYYFNIMGRTAKVNCHGDRCIFAVSNQTSKFKIVFIWSILRAMRRITRDVNSTIGLKLMAVQTYHVFCLYVTIWRFIYIYIYPHYLHGWSTVACKLQHGNSIFYSPLSFSSGVFSFLFETSNFKIFC